MLHLQTDEEHGAELARVQSVSLNNDHLSSVIDIDDRFSFLQKLLKSFSLCMTFVHNCKQSDGYLKHTGQLFPTDIDEALQAWIHCALLTSFPEEITAI